MGILRRQLPSGPVTFKPFQVFSSASLYYRATALSGFSTHQTARGEPVATLIIEREVAQTVVVKVSITTVQRLMDVAHKMQQPANEEVVCEARVRAASEMPNPHARRLVATATRQLKTRVWQTEASFPER